MFVVTVTFTLKPDRVEDFLPLMRANAQASLREETGCRQFDICRNPDVPTSIFLYEVYDDQAAFCLHLASAHFQQFDAAVSGMITGKTAHTYAEVWQ